MKILYLKAYYEPEVYASSHLNNSLIEDLIKADHQVHIITPLPTRGVSETVRNAYKNRKLEITQGGMLVVKRFYLPKESKNAASRALRYFMSGFMTLYFGLKAKDMDVVFAGSTPPIIGLFAGIIKKIKKIPFVYSLQDVFPDSLIHTGLAKENSFLVKIGRRIERSTYKNADKIVVISEDFRVNLKDKGVADDKIETVYNWVDENAVTPVIRSENELIEKFGLNKDDFFVVYAGNLGRAQNIEVILNAAQQLKPYKDITILIFGSGQQETYYKNLAAKSNLGNVKFHPIQPYHLVSNVYSLGDVGIVTCKQGLGKSAMPSKTWSILSTETPVIANFDENTDLQKIIIANNLGLFTRCGDDLGLAEAILKLYGDQKMKLEMGQNGRRYVQLNLNRKKGTQNYIDILTNILGAK